MSAEREAHGQGSQSAARLVVIGASAGGVEALSKLADMLPGDFPVAIVVVLHVPPSATSVLPEILGRRGRLPAAHARDGDRIEPGRIYVAPPDEHLLVQDSRVRLTRGPRENNHRPTATSGVCSASPAWTGSSPGRSVADMPRVPSEARSPAEFRLASHQVAGDVWVVSLSGDCSGSAGADLGDHLASLPRNGSMQAVVDLTAATAVQSALLTSVIQSARDGRKNGVTTTVVSDDGAVRRALGNAEKRETSSSSNFSPPASGER